MKNIFLDNKREIMEESVLNFNNIKLNQDPYEQLREQLDRHEVKSINNYGGKKTKLFEGRNIYPATYEGFIDTLDAHGWDVYDCVSLKKGDKKYDGYHIGNRNYLNEEHLQQSINEVKSALEDYFDGNVQFTTAKYRYAPENQELCVVLDKDIFDYADDQLEFNFMNESIHESYKEAPYQAHLLGRLISDCEYVLGACNTAYNDSTVPFGPKSGCLKHLWAGNVDDQISEMRRLKKYLDDSGFEAPISNEDIDDYETRLHDFLG